MKEKVDIGIVSECSNRIKLSDQVKGLLWSLSPVMNCLHRVVSDTWPRAAWDQQKDFLCLLKWPMIHVPLLGYSHVIVYISLLHKSTARTMYEYEGQKKRRHLFSKNPLYHLNLQPP